MSKAPVVKTRPGSVANQKETISVTQIHGKLIAMDAVQKRRNVPLMRGIVI